MKKRQNEQDLAENNNSLECTFKPVIKDYNGDYFENNPLKEDFLVK